jgi:hypothetical protein
MKSDSQSGPSGPGSKETGAQINFFCLSAVRQAKWNRSGHFLAAAFPRVQRPHSEDGSRAAAPLLRGEAAAAVSGAEEGLLLLRARAAPCLRRR